MKLSTILEEFLIVTPGMTAKVRIWKGGDEKMESGWTVKSVAGGYVTLTKGGKTINTPGVNVFPTNEAVNESISWDDVRYLLDQIKYGIKNRIIALHYYFEQGGRDLPEEEFHRQGRNKGIDTEALSTVYQNPQGSLLKTMNDAAAQRPAETAIKIVAFLKALKFMSK